MAWVDFYMDTGAGSNLNSGSTAGGATYTSTAGNFDGTSVFTPTDGSTPASSINAGDYVSLYNTGDTNTRCVAKVQTVGAGVNGTITIDTTVKYGTVPTSNSGSRALKAGGAWADLGMTAASAALNTGTVPQSTRINIKAGTYANTSTSRTFSLAGTTLLPIWWRGYKASIGDQDSNNVAVAGTDIPAITFTTGQLVIASGASYQVWSNLDITGASITANGQVVAGGAYNIFYGCRFQCTGANANSSAITFTSNGNACLAVRCAMKATTTAAQCVSMACTFTYIRNCTIVNGAIGVNISAASNMLSACVFDSQAGDAVKTNQSLVVLGCSFYAPTGHGINLTGVSGNGVTIGNCYFSTVNQASKAAINNTSGTNSFQFRIFGNAYFNCTATVTGLTETFAITDSGTLASEAFNNPGSQDFSIKAAGQAIANPSTFENVSLYQGYTDVGAVQHLATGGPTGQIMRVTGQHFQAN